MSLIIFVHTCEAYETSRAKVIESTWAQGLSNVVFVTDNPTSVLENNIYLGPYTPGPTYHPDTVRKMFRVYMEKYSKSYPYLMIIDDDAYLFHDKLVQYLEYFDNTEPYLIGDFINWHTGMSDPNCNSIRLWHYDVLKYTYNTWFSGGPGFVCTRSACEMFMRAFDTGQLPSLCNHDVWLSRIVDELRLPIKKNNAPGFHQAPGVIKKYPKDSKMLISIHFARDMEGLVQFHKMNCTNA